MNANERIDLYKKQLEENDIAFVNQSWTCSRCKKDLLDDEFTKNIAKKGILITGCRFCNHSFCE